MTQRPRLTGAFLAMILGPVSIGGVFAGATVDHVSDSRRRDRLDFAAVSEPATINAAGAGLSTAAARAVQAAGWPKAGPIGGAQGQYVHRIDPQPGRAPQVAISTPITTASGLFTVVGAIMLGVAVGALGAASAFARFGTKPLSQIAEAAERAAHGDLDTRVAVRRDDVIGRLGGAVNRMTREMQVYAGALAASRDQLRGDLVRIGDALASTHDLPKIIEVILASAVTATGARAGVVMLADPDDDRLRLGCSHGFDDYASALLEPLIVRFGSGLLGGVAASGGAQHGRGTDVELTDGEPPCETFLAVTLRVPPSAGDQTGIRGVLALYDRVGGKGFDDADLSTVKTFAGHAAIAVDNVRQHDEAKRLSHTDPLTGLYNYRHLRDLLRREAHRAARFGRSLAVLVMDLDRFKDVNDTYGHAAGDAVLVEFARRVSAEIRGVDLAFRYGGEEFVLLLPETDAHGGGAVAERLRDAIRNTPVPAPGGHAPDNTGAVQVSITVSIGVAVYPDHGTSGAMVLEAADDALYAAKAAGRDTYRLAVPLRDESPPPAPLATPSTLTAADVRGDLGLESESVVTPVDVTGQVGTGNESRPQRSRRGRSGASPTPPPPRQARGR